MKMRQLVRLMVSRTAVYAVGSIGGRAMRGVAILACFSGVLWGMPASAEELSVPADYQGRQIELRADFEKPAGGGPFPAVVVLHACGRALLQQQSYATLQLDSFDQLS